VGESTRPSSGRRSGWAARTAAANRIFVRNAAEISGSRSSRRHEIAEPPLATANAASPEITGKPRSGRGCVSQDGSGQFEHRRIERAFEPGGKPLAAIGF
jgi:hypothetical protein